MMTIFEEHDFEKALWHKINLTVLNFKIQDIQKLASSIENYQIKGTFVGVINIDLLRDIKI